MRVYVFRSDGCVGCEVVDDAHMRALAARIGCDIETRYFDVSSIANWRRLIALEERYRDTDNEMPVVFVGGNVLGGERELSQMLESAIALLASAGGSAWPDETDHGA